MSTLQMVLSQLIRDGKVTVDIPDLDMEQLVNAVKNQSAWTLNCIAGYILDEELTDSEKVDCIRRELEQSGVLG